jgi:hypothetical protein
LEVRTDINDTILHRARVPARSARACGQSFFADPAGRDFTIDTAIDGLDLTPYAQLFASIYHHESQARAV